MRLFRALAASFSYFSIFPSKTFDISADGDAIALLPVVGLVIGALSGGAAYGAYLLTHSSILAAIVAWVASVALSGAIHIDGFLDCCDGLFAMVSPERRLEIMRDPHHGTYAIVGMALLSALWLYALAQITPVFLPVILAGVGYLSRFAACVCADQFRGQTKAQRRAASRLLIPVNFVMLLAVTMAPRGFFHPSGSWPLATAMLAVAVGVPIAAAFLIGWFARRRLGGVVNGDCFGAVAVVTEVALLLAVPFLTPSP